MLGWRDVDASYRLSTGAAKVMFQEVLTEPETSLWFG